MTELALTVSRRIAAPPERVFAAWLDPDLLAGFMRPGDDVTVPHASVDARPGGRFAIVMRTGGRDLPHAGTYLEIDPPRRLVFTWVWEDDRAQADQLIEIDFEEVDGATRVRFTHSGLWDEESVASHEEGWGNAFDNLERTLAG
jgi:uncharacterized protein YndB with AHSA1/START domain